MGILNDDFRSDLAQLILLLLDADSHNLINQLLHMKIITPEQNTEELRMGIDDLLNSIWASNWTRWTEYWKS
jgi:ubiquinone biosynthesis protein